MQLTNVTCDLCGSSRSEPILTRGDLNTDLEGDFTLVKCLDCGLIYLNPRPAISSFGEIYPEDYDQYSHTTNDSPKTRFLPNFGIRKRIYRINKYKKAGNLCDIGCATGDFLEGLKKDKHWILFGVEPSVKAFEYLQRQGFISYNGFFSSISFPNVKFDVITMWNVIEHLQSPLSTLQEIKKSLTTDGLLIFTTPNFDSFDRHIFGKYWVGYELPRHFYVFSIQSIKFLLQKAGFELIESSCLYGAHALFMTSLLFKLRSKKIISPFWKKILFSPLLKLLFAPYFLLTNILKKSSPITIIAKPKVYCD
jgi:SAM-dependent methyltransferase